MFAKQSRTAVMVLLTMVSSIASAQVKSLCEKGENTVWSCQSGKKIYSICASRDLTGTIGYLQYRAGTLEKTEFKFPAELQHPKGRFEYGLLAHGAYLSFKNGHYSYEISEPLIGQPAIDISKADRHLSTLQCSTSTQSLTDNATMDIFKTVGAYQ